MDQSKPFHYFQVYNFNVRALVQTESTPQGACLSLMLHYADSG